MRKLNPVNTAPSPSPSPSLTNSHPDPTGPSFFPPIPIADSAFDVATLSLISSLLLLSLLSLSSIFYLRLKSRTSHHLQNFNSLWFARLLFVLFVSLWSLAEILRLPFLYRHNVFPFLPYLTLPQQSVICKIHIVFSLGFLQPGFLTTLLFLLNASIKKRGPLCPIGIILLACFPVAILQMFFVFFEPFDDKLPNVFYTSSVLSTDDEVLLCRYPLFSTVVFAGFGIGYSFAFLFSYWRVVSLVINKGTRARIHVLAFSVLICLPIQVLFLALSSFWLPESPVYGGVMLGMFFSVLSCAAVGEGILVIRPIADALAAGGDCSAWKPGSVLWSRPTEEGRRETAVEGSQ
ncbi:hypothetical protein RHMOL_Rhmol03G0235800 [Rhododendron molle]|uniref:Uncharacterized protein n=1 Tax=Rhododendron molle TaxID=49168 RepID=A0ACC0PHE1_RHOML|nr:hypothetical protein RHMOL_Rhmol03G0235800 [Rhododendron molle]